ncbi:MAG: hypothetical protein LBQ50_13490 [Planctomycetaceae bacterium]|nr:hypothetical protein [Planctomycetaceae bacterium]
MHNRRCSAAQPPDRVPPPRQSRAATILSSPISCVQFHKLIFLMMSSLRDLLVVGAIVRRLCIMSSLRDC